VLRIIEGAAFLPRKVVLVVIRKYSIRSEIRWEFGYLSLPGLLGAIWVETASGTLPFSCPFGAPKGSKRQQTAAQSEG
jgi:hypothetical protein